jgi:tripartite-type tricarboxylate transporter receptor subunit TctC
VVLDQIAAATVKAQASPDFKARLEAQGFDVPQEHGDAFAATIAAETERWAQVVKATGFRANE